VEESGYGVHGSLILDFASRHRGDPQETSYGHFPFHYWRAIYAAKLDHKIHLKNYLTQFPFSFAKWVAKGIFKYHKKKKTKK
jgi:hypothetical protein